MIPRYKAIWAAKEYLGFRKNRSLKATREYIERQDLQKEIKRRDWLIDSRKIIKMLKY